MNSKYAKTVTLIFLGILLVGFSVFVWAVQTGKITISANAPAPAIISLTAKAVSENQIDLNWSSWGTYNKKPVQKYVLKLADSPGARCAATSKCVQLPLYEGTGTSFSHKNLTPNTTYKYIILVYYDYTGTNFKTEASATTLAAAEGAKINANAISDTQINLDWSAPSTYNNASLDKYKLELRTCASCPSAAECLCENTFTTLYEGKGTNFEHKNLKADTDYHYKISAFYSGSKEAKYSAEIDSATKSGEACVELGGVGPNGSLGPNDPNKNKKCCAGLVLETPLTASIFDPNTETCKQMVGAGTVCLACGDGKCDSKYENKCNCPEDCPESSKNCKNNSDCSSNEFCSIHSGSCQGNGKCQNKPEICTEEYSPVCGCDGKTYNNKCYANMAGVSITYNEECKNNPKPVAPSDLKATALNQNTIKLTWSGISKDLANDFTVYTNPPIGRINNSGTGTTISFEVSGLDCGQTYSYYVTSNNNQGESDPSQRASATTAACSQASSTSQLGLGIASLVSTGSNLWINILIALIGTAGIGYFIFRKEIWNK